MENQMLSMKLQQDDDGKEPSGSAVVSLTSTVSGNLPQQLQVGEEISFGLDHQDKDSDDDFSIHLKDDTENCGPPRKFKLKSLQKNVNATKTATADDESTSGPENGITKVHSFRLEEWMTSSEEDDDDECSDMISADYSRQQQHGRDAMLIRRTKQQKEEEKDVIFSMEIVVSKERNEENDDNSASTLSSLDSFRETSMDQDILSDSDPAISHDRANLLGQSYRSSGSEDQHVLFSPTLDNDKQQKYTLDTVQGINRILSQDEETIEDHSDNHGDDHTSLNHQHHDSHGKVSVATRISPYSIESSKKTGEKSQRRKGRKSPRSPRSNTGSMNKTSTAKARAKKVITPLWSPNKLPFGNESSSSVLFEDEGSPDDAIMPLLVESSSTLARRNKKDGVSGEDARQHSLSCEQLGKSRGTSVSAMSPVNLRKRSDNIKEEMVPCPNAFFSPESHGRTFLPKCFQSDANAAKANFSLPLVGSEDIFKNEPFDDRSSFGESATTSSVTSSRGLEYLDENGNRPAFLSDVEYTTPLIDKSELPTTKTKKSLNRKRSLVQSQAKETEKSQNNMLLAGVLRSGHLDVGSDEHDMRSDDLSSKKSQIKHIGLLSCMNDDSSVNRLSALGSVSTSQANNDSDDCDDFSVMSEISADSIHRNVEVKRTNRKKKTRRGKPLNSSNIAAPSTSGKDGISNNECNATNAKKKKAAKKARPKKRGKKSEFQTAGDTTGEKKAEDDVEDAKLPVNAPKMEMKERIEAILNNKDLIYSDIERNLSVITSILNPEVNVEENETRPVNIRVKSKGTDDLNQGLLRNGLSRRLGRSRSITRQRGKSRTRGKSADGPKEKLTTRSRSNSLDPGLGLNLDVSNCRLRGRKKNVMETKKSENTVGEVTDTGYRRKENDSDISMNKSNQDQRDPKSNKEKVSRLSKTNQMTKNGRDHISDKSQWPQMQLDMNTVGSRKDEISGLQVSINLIKEPLTNSFQKRIARVLSPRGGKSKDIGKNQSLIGSNFESVVTQHPDADAPGFPKPHRRSEKDIAKGKSNHVKSKTELQDGSAAIELSLPTQKGGRSTSTGSRSKPLKKGEMPSIESQLDLDIREALQRHNLGSTVSTLVLGSPLSCNERSKKSVKKRNRVEKQKNSDDFPCKIPPGLIESEDETCLDPSTSDIFITSNGITEPADEPFIAVAQMPSHGANSDRHSDQSSTDMEKLRLEVKQTRKSTKQKILDLRSETEEEILNMEHQLEHQKMSLLSKLESLGVQSDPAEGIKYLRSNKVAKLHEEGKQLRKEIKRLEEEKLEQISLTNQLITESVDIQRQTTEIVSKIARAELQNMKHASAMNALRLAHSSTSTLLCKDPAKLSKF